jgi:hypothetical protein
MEFQALRSLPEMLFQQSASLADKPFLWRKQDGVFRRSAARPVPDQPAGAASSTWRRSAIAWRW